MAPCGGDARCTEEIRVLRCPKHKSIRAAPIKLALLAAGNVPQADNRMYPARRLHPRTSKRFGCCRETIWCVDEPLLSPLRLNRFQATERPSESSVPSQELRKYRRGGERLINEGSIGSGPAAK